MAYAYGALQTLHVIHLKCVTYQTIGLTQKQLASVRGCNACRVLSAVLKHGQGVIDALIHRFPAEHPNDAAHLAYSRSAYRRSTRPSARHATHDGLQPLQHDLLKGQQNTDHV